MVANSPPAAEVRGTLNNHRTGQELTYHGKLHMRISTLQRDPKNVCSTESIQRALKRRQRSNSQLGECGCGGYRILFANCL